MIASYGMINPAQLLIGSGTGLNVSFGRIHSYIAQIKREKTGFRPFGNCCFLTTPFIFWLLTCTTR